MNWKKNVNKMNRESMNKMENYKSYPEWKKKL